MGTKTFAEAKERYKRMTGETWKPSISNVRAGFEDDPKRGFSTPSEFLLSVGKHGSETLCTEANDHRLRFLAASGMFNDGFLAPAAFHPEGETLRKDLPDPFAGRTTILSMPAPEVKIGYRVDPDHSTSVSSGLTLSRHPEGEEIASSQMSLGQLALRAESLAGLSYATEEILMDSPRTFMDILSAGFRTELTGKLLHERLHGTGVMEFVGINTSSGAIAVAKESGQAADTIVGANLSKMMARCYGYDNARWIANPDTAPQLLACVTATGAPCLTPSQSGETALDCLGRPLHFSEFCNSLGDAGDLVLVNPAEYVEGEYRPLNTTESIHVRFINHERCFKFTIRNAGAPWWNSPLTPKYGAATLSPFVKLAARA